MRSAFRRVIRGHVVKSWPKVAPEDKPPWRPEFSDGCTLVSDPPEVVHCCLEHDRAYYEAKGGSAGRTKADREFLECMKTAGWTWRARLRWLGVRIGGGEIWFS